MNISILPTLDKKYILDRITQEQIMERYLGISVVFDELVVAPSIIRKDNSPTCGFKYNMHGRLRFKDFGPGGFWGDCFDVVAKALNIDSNNSKSFQLILHTIAKDFRIHKYVDNNEVINYNKITNPFFSKPKKKDKLIFHIAPRPFNYHDDSYWNRFNVNRKLLTLGKVYAAQQISLSRIGTYPTQIYTYNPKDPAYCYYDGKDEDGIDKWKIYYPLRNKNEQRFHSNNSFTQGKHMITCGRVGVITKSLKDILSFRSFGLQAIAPPAESVLLSEDDYWFMKTKFDFLISCMDYDRAGMLMSKKLWKTYRIQPMMFTNKYFGAPVDYGIKDFAEHVDVKGVNDTQKLLDKIAAKHLKDFRKLDKYYYKSLRNIL